MANIRKPNHLHVLEGTYRADRHGPIDEGLGDTKNPLPDMPHPPDTLCEEGKMEWWRVVSILQPYGVIKATDFGAMLCYCALFGQLVRDPKNINVALCSQLRGCMNDLGLTPVSRAKIQLPGGDSGKTTGNKFNDL